MNIENFISDAVRRSVEALYGTLDGEQLQIQKTRKEFEGDYTLVTFPLLRRSRKSPEATATEIGGYMTANVPEIKSFNVIKGFLNLVLDGAFWAARFDEVAADADFGQAPATGRTVMIEYSSPNTNKPLHLGHIRNNLLGYSVAQILKAHYRKFHPMNGDFRLTHQIHSDNRKNKYCTMQKQLSVFSYIVSSLFSYFIDLIKM